MRGFFGALALKTSGRELSSKSHGEIRTSCATTHIFVRSMKVPRPWCAVAADTVVNSEALRRSFAAVTPGSSRRLHAFGIRVSTSRLVLPHLKPDGERIVAYLERRTPWDS